ncbi:MAG: hypothetical protein ACE5H0_15265 [Bacteroidota bacterium]
MRDAKPPFKFDLRDLLTRARQQFNDRVIGVSINLPFLTFLVQPEATETKVAKEIVIRLADRRVLNAFECCDDCIDKALASLQEIRSLLVDKQVDLSKFTNGPLYLLIELMLEAIRQFFTYEERLRNRRNTVFELPARFRPPDSREQYFAALEMLRAHLHRCLLQVSAIAETEIPKIADHMRYDQAWQLEAYERPAIETEVSTD